MARQNFVGVVVSTGKMMKTCKVRVTRTVYNKIINKEILSRKDYLVHDEGEICTEGDIVRIESCRPLSKRKSFAIAEIKSNEGQQFVTYENKAKQDVKADSQEEVQRYYEQVARDETELKKIYDLRFLESKARLPQGSLTAEEEAQIAQIKEKYTIESHQLPSDLLKLEITAQQERTANAGSELLANIEEREVNEKLAETDRFNGTLAQYLIEIGKGPSIFQELGKPLPKKNNIAKNIIRKQIAESGILSQVKDLNDFYEVKNIINKDDQEFTLSKLKETLARFQLIK